MNKLNFNVNDMKLLNLIILLLMLIQLVSCTGENKPLLDADKKVNLANTFYNNELYHAAIEEYLDYLEHYNIETNKQANIYYQIANIYFNRLHDYDKAITYYIRIKYLYPESNLQTDVGKRIVNCLERLNRSTDAQRVLERETALKPDQVEEKRPGAVLATIGEKQITQGDLDFEINQLPPYMQTQFNTKSKKLEFLQQYIAEELLYDSAKRKNLEKDKDIIEGTFRAQKGLMAQKILQDEIQQMVKINPADVELYYKANKEKYSEKNEDGKVTQPISYTECAEQVARDLFRERQQEAYQKLIERLMKAENVTIYEKRIK